MIIHTYLTKSNVSKLLGQLLFPVFKMYIKEMTECLNPTTTKDTSKVDTRQIKVNSTTLSFFVE